MARQTNLLAMALDAPKRKATLPPDRDDLVLSLMAKQASDRMGTPVHSVVEGLTRVANMGLLGYMSSKKDRDEQDRRTRLADMLLGGSSISSADPGNTKLASALRGEPRVDTSYADRTIGVESAGDPTARNPRSSATGAGQFIDSTWLETVSSHRPDLTEGRSRDEILAMRNDPELSREMTDAYGNQNAQFLESRGLPVNDGTKYLAHFAGPAGAQSVLSTDPSTPVSQLLSRDAIASNPFLAGMTAGDLTAWASRKMGGGSGNGNLPGGSGSDDLSQPRLSSEQLSGLVPFDTRTPAEKAGDPLTTEQLSAMVPFTAQPPQAPGSTDTMQRLSPVPSSSRERIVGRELPQDIPHAFSGGYGAANPELGIGAGGAVPTEAPRRPSPASAAAQSLPQQGGPANLRQALGGFVGDPGDFNAMARQHRQTRQLPGLNGMMQGQGQPRVSPTGHSAPPAPQAGQIAPDVQPQPLGAPQGQQQAQQGHPLLQGVSMEERSMLRHMVESGEMSGPQVFEYLQKRQEAQQPDYQYVKTPEGIVQIDKRNGQTQLVHQADPAASGRTIPGTSIDLDSSMGEKYAAYVNQGFSHEQALGVASGRFDLRVTDAGIPVMVDRLSNQEVPIQRLGPTEIGQRAQLGPTPGPQQGQPQQAGQTDALGLNPRRDRTLYELADSGTGLWNVIGDFVGRVGPQFVPGDKPFFADQREAVTTIRTANRGLVRALQQSPRYAEGERTSIEKEIALNPSIGMSPEAWRQSAVAVDSLLRTWWAEDMQDAQSSTLAAEDRQRALASARAIERYLQILGVPQGNGQGGGQGEPVSVTSPAEAHALPPGTLYRTPDGQTYRPPAGESPQAAQQHPPFDANGWPVIAETGESFPPEAILEQARQEIANGRSREAVIQRLHEMGIDPRGL